MRICTIIKCVICCFKGEISMHQEIAARNSKGISNNHRQKIRTGKSRNYWPFFASGGFAVSMKRRRGVPSGGKRDVDIRK